MGKITSMHFAGWKLGLKTGMYYLRTMAASAPIQFTVDQEALKVADTNVARTTGLKKRAGGSYNSVASPQPSTAPQPMYDSKMPNGQNSTPNGVVTPAQTPPPQEAEQQKPQPQRKERKFGRATSAVHNPEFPADQDEGDSPKIVAVDGEKIGPKEEELPEPALKEEKDDAEDKEDESKGREGDIYADAVLACSIENRDACVMCSG